MHKASQSVQLSDLNQIIKSVSDAITEQLIRIIEGQLISPWTSFAMGALTSALSNKIQDALIRNSDLGKQMLDEKVKELQDLVNDPNSLDDAKLSLQNDINGLQTYGGLINHEAKKYTIAYCQSENIYYIQKRNQKASHETVVSQ
jgi:hypothetical protein